MIQDSINQMLGAIAIGSRLGGDVIKQEKATRVNTAINDYKSNLSMQGAGKAKIDALKEQNKSINETIANSKDLTDEQLLNLTQDINSNQADIDKYNKSINELQKEAKSNEDEMIKASGLKREGKEVVPNKKHQLPFTKTLQTDVLSALREKNAGETLAEAKSMKDDVISSLREDKKSLINESKQLSKQEQMAQKARMSMVRKARQQIIQANNNHITNLNKTPVTPGQIRKENWGEEQDYGI